MVKHCHQFGGIFQQLATMVSEQGELAIRIDENVDDTLANVDNAQTQLLKYLNSVSSNRWLIMKILPCSYHSSASSSSSSRESTSRAVVRARIPACNVTTTLIGLPIRRCRRHFHSVPTIVLRLGRVAMRDDEDVHPSSPRARGASTTLRASS